MFLHCDAQRSRYSKICSKIKIKEQRQNGSRWDFIWICEKGRDEIFQEQKSLYEVVKTRRVCKYSKSGDAYWNMAEISFKCASFSYSYLMLSVCLDYYLLFLWCILYNTVWKRIAYLRTLDKATVQCKIIDQMLIIHNVQMAFRWFLLFYLFSY